MKAARDRGDMAYLRYDKTNVQPPFQDQPQQRPTLHHEAFIQCLVYHVYNTVFTHTMDYNYLFEGQTFRSFAPSTLSILWSGLMLTQAYFFFFIIWCLCIFYNKTHFFTQPYLLWACCTAVTPCCLCECNRGCVEAKIVKPL